MYLECVRAHVYVYRSFEPGKRSGRAASPAAHGHSPQWGWRIEKGSGPQGEREGPTQLTGRGVYRRNCVTVGIHVKQEELITVVHRWHCMSFHSHLVQPFILHSKEKVWNIDDLSAGMQTNTTWARFWLCPCRRLHPEQGYFSLSGASHPWSHPPPTPCHLILLKSSDEVTVGIGDQKSTSSHLSFSNWCDVSLPSL